jgi:putative SOS response-associated peptidase YedK
MSWKSECQNRLMCYSSRIWADYRRYVKEFGATLDIKEFVRVFWERRNDPRVKIPKALEAAFVDSQEAAGAEIRALIEEFSREQAAQLEQELFEQRRRLADAERRLTTKPTKAASESKRIASNKVARALDRLADLKRTDLQDEDSRIYPLYYAPVLIMEDGRLVVKPMRYQCRPAGKPAFYDSKYPGTYNARRDNLTGFWNELYGFSHGVVVMNSFFENVNRHRAEGRELREGEEPSNVVLEFNPRPQQDMLVACLWSRWTAPGQPDLLSFAAITDEPPPEVAAAGHDRCIVPIKPENLNAWLNPGILNLAAIDAILEDRARPHYEHRWLMAA